MILTILGFLFSAVIALVLFWLALLGIYVFVRYVLPMALLLALGFGLVWGINHISPKTVKASKTENVKTVCNPQDNKCVTMRYTF